MIVDVLIKALLNVKYHAFIAQLNISIEYSFIDSCNDNDLEEEVHKQAMKHSSINLRKNVVCQVYTTDVRLN